MAPAAERVDGYVQRRQAIGNATQDGVMDGEQLIGINFGRHRAAQYSVFKYTMCIAAVPYGSVPPVRMNFPKPHNSPIIPALIFSRSFTLLGSNLSAQVEKSFPQVQESD